MATAAWELDRGERALAAGEYSMAIARYDHALELSRDAQLIQVERSARLGVARSLTGQGQPDSAMALLGLAQGQSTTVGASEWEGPAGGLLYKNNSCWYDLWLWEGDVQIDIWASGNPAFGEWPRLRVSLSGRELGEIEVSSGDFDSYTLTTDVATGHYRLEVGLVNGYYSEGRGHRWAELGSAQIAAVARD